MSEEVVKSDETQEDIIKADVGDTVQIKRGAKKGKKGKVVTLRDNSVIVELGINPNTGEPVKTVINHKNYKKVK